tara:strand:- start:677 stop:1303 length:627 start_codon:yes stop_codon:yes gene_type:complete
MKLEKIDINGKKTFLDIEDSFISSKLNKQLISNVLFKTIANFKRRKAKTKQKNEIIGSTAKIYAQKGTGNARHASRKAPIFVGGGVAHGPKGENNYRFKKVNKSEKRISIKSLISEKNNSKDLIIFDDFDKEIKKTKEMNNLLIKLEANNSLIILDKKSKEKIYKSLRNIPNIKTTDINHFSAYDIAKYKKIIFTESSIKELEKRYNK